MPNINSVNIMQLSNREGQMIAPFTPEHAIYDTNGIRLDVKLKALDIDRILALVKRFSGGGGNGISAIFSVDNDEEGFMNNVAEVMRDVNDSTSIDGNTAYNTYLAVLEIDIYNFMGIEVMNSNERKAYTLAKVTTCTDGAIDVIFDLDFYSYRYHFSQTALIDGQPMSQLYFEESGISK